MKPFGVAGSEIAGKNVLNLIPHAVLVMCLMSDYNLVHQI